METAKSGEHDSYELMKYGFTFATLDAGLKSMDIPKDMFPRDYRNKSKSQIEKILAKILKKCNNDQISLVLVARLFLSPYGMKLIEMGFVSLLIDTLSKSIEKKDIQTIGQVLFALDGSLKTLGLKNDLSPNDLKIFFDKKLMKLVLKAMKLGVYRTNKINLDNSMMLMLLYPCLCTFNALMRFPAPSDHLLISKKLVFITEVIAKILETSNELNDGKQGYFIETCVAFNLLRPYYDATYVNVPPNQQPHMIRLERAGAIENWAKFAHKSTLDENTEMALEALTLFSYVNVVKVFYTCSHLVALENLKKAPTDHLLLHIECIRFLCDLHFNSLKYPDIQRKLKEIKVNTIMLDNLFMLSDIKFDNKYLIPMEQAEECLFLYLTLLWENDEEERQKVLRDDVRNVYDVFISSFLRHANNVKLGSNIEVDNTIRVYSSFLRTTIDIELPFSVKFVRSNVPNILVDFILQNSIPDEVLLEVATLYLKLFSNFPQEMIEKLMLGKDDFVKLVECILSRSKNSDSKSSKMLKRLLYILCSVKKLFDAEASVEFYEDLILTWQEEPQDKPVKISICALCKSVDAKMKCGSCKGVMYCNRDCQLKDWQKHQVDCISPV